MKEKIDTSWQKVATWYDSNVGAEGHYYHKQIILPKLMALMDFKKVENPHVLDIGCGQGVLARSIPKNVLYAGVDFSKKLIQLAKQHPIKKSDRFFCYDCTEPFDLEMHDFSHATIILALQNMENPEQVLKNARKHLRKNGKLFIVLNHPSFRIPRQSSWGIDEAQKIQYRRINKYLTPMKIPLQMHPGKEDSVVTWSFHYPLSNMSKMLKEAGFVIVEMEEWISDKISVGKAAKMENRSREEFPLFLTIVAEATLG